MATKSVQINEKEITATVSASDEVLEANEAAEVIPERNLTRAIWTIVYGVALPCIPIVVISAVLLYIIFHYRLVLHPGLPELQIPPSSTNDDLLSDLSKLKKEGGEWAYYVKYNPSTITTIASWTSRIVPYLSSSIMALVAFFAARHIVLMSKHGEDSRLPNPEQLALLISTLGGNGFGPLREVILYRFVKKGRLVHPLPAAISAFTIITVMALIIPVIDTWFGVATTAQTVIQIDTKDPSLIYGRGLSSSVCPHGADDSTSNTMLVNKTAFWPCNVWTDGHNPDSRFLPGEGEAGNILFGASNLTQIHNHTDTAGSVFWYLGSPSQNSVQDYQAKTIATISQCQPMTRQQCNITYTENNGTERFQCNENFVGSFGLTGLNVSATGVEENGAPNIGVAFSGNSELTEVTGEILSARPNSYYTTLDPQIYTTNPLYYGVWAFGFPGPDITGGIVDNDDSYYWGDLHGGVWMLNCSTMVYDVTYSWVNGTVTSFNKSMSSPELAALLTGPLAVGSSPYVRNSLTSVAMAAGSANYSAGIARIFSNEFSKLLLAYSVGALETQVVLKQQDRFTIADIARVPMIPLYLLLATKGLYVLAVIVLAIAAYAFTHPAETEIVKDQLSVKGLTSAHFDRPDVMQDYAVQQIKSHMSSADPDMPQSSSPKEEKTNEPVKPGLRHAATAPVQGTAPKKEAKVGLMPAVDGTWQFVVKANGVWNSVKPIVESIVVEEAKAGGLGGAGDVIAAWK